MRPVKELADTINHYAPALTLLVVIGGFVWTIATWNVEFETVKGDLEDLSVQMEAVQDDVRSVRETLPHIVSCMIDLERSWITDSLTTFSNLVDDLASSPALDPADFLDRTLPASCEQARLQTTPRTN